MDPEKVKAALEAIKNGDAAAALEILEAMVVNAAGGDDAAPADEAPAEPLAETPEEAPPEPGEEKNVATALMRLTATASASEALVELTRRLARVDAVDAERAALELSARRDLVAELVTLGVEFPATAWAGNAKDRNPVKRLADEPIAELRARVALHRKSPRASVAPPVSGAPTIQALSANEIAACKKRGIDPTEFAARKAAAVRRSA